MGLDSRKCVHLPGGKNQEHVHMQLLHAFLHIHRSTYKQSVHVCSCKPLHNNASAAVAADMRCTHSAEQSYGHMQLLQASLNTGHKCWEQSGSSCGCVPRQEAYQAGQWQRRWLGRGPLGLHTAWCSSCCSCHPLRQVSTCITPTS